MSAEVVEAEIMMAREAVPDLDRMSPERQEAWLVDAAITQTHGKAELLVPLAEMLPPGSAAFHTLSEAAFDGRTSLFDQVQILSALSRSRFSDTRAAWEFGLDAAVAMVPVFPEDQHQDPRPFVELARGQASQSVLDMLYGHIRSRAASIASPVFLAIGRSRLESGDPDVGDILHQKKLLAADRNELLVLQARSYARADRARDARQLIDNSVGPETHLQIELQVAAVEQDRYSRWDMLEGVLARPHFMKPEDRLRVVRTLLECERSDLAVSLAASIPLIDGTTSTNDDEYKAAMLAIAEHQALRQGNTAAAGKTLDTAAEVIAVNLAHAEQQQQREAPDSDSSAARCAYRSARALEEIDCLRGQILAVTKPNAMYEAVGLVVPERYSDAYAANLIAGKLSPVLAESGRVGEAAGLIARVDDDRYYYNKSAMYGALAGTVRQRRQRQILVWTATSSQVSR